MSGSGRRRSSKWDITEDISPDNLPDGNRPSRRGDSVHDRQSRETLPGRRGFYRSESSQDETMLGWEKGRSHGTRISPDERIRRNRSRSPRASWAKPYRNSRSPSRSRSRSPVRNFRREPEYDDRNRGRSGQVCRDYAAGRCRRGSGCPFIHDGSPGLGNRRNAEFSVPERMESRNRKDGSSRYSSNGWKDQNMHERALPLCKDFLKGNCRWGSSCRFPHYAAANDYSGKATARDVHRDGDYHRRSRDGDYDRRSRDGYSGRSYDDERPKTSNTICKYFAAGHCCSGNRCRCSHHSQDDLVRERSVNENDNGVGAADQVWNGPRGNRSRYSHHSQEDLVRERSINENDKNGLGGADQVWNVPRWSDAEMQPVADVVVGKGREEERRWKMDAPSAGWSENESCKQNSTSSNRGWIATAVDDTVSINEKQQRMDATVSNVDFPELKGAEKCHDDIGNQAPSYNAESNIPISQFSYFGGEQGAPQEAPTIPERWGNPYSEHKFIQVEDGGAIYQNQDENGVGRRSKNVSSSIMSGGATCQNGEILAVQPMLNANAASSIMYGGGTCQNGQIMDGQPMTSTDAVGQCQGTFPLLHSDVPTSHGQTVDEGKLNSGEYNENVNTSQATSAPAPGASISEQLAKFTHLSTTLAQLLERTQNQQQSQQYAAIPSVAAVDSNLASSMASAPTVSVMPSSLHNPAAESMAQYDPLCDSIESKVPEANKQHSLENVIAQTSSMHPSSDIGTLPGAPAPPVNGTPAEGNERGSVVIPDKVENGGAIIKETGKTNENEPSEDKAAGDDGNKAKESKEIRPFKFALVEFAKELLKPAWKESQVSREAYKTIVKKVVDKVVDTLPVAHIPHGKEKIEHYLSDSKPKLSKLVQAYVEKFQKS